MFLEPGYVGQAMTLVVKNITPNVPVDEVLFEIITPTALPGFAENATHPSIEAVGTQDDYSFRRTQDARSISITRSSVPESQYGGRFESDRVWTRFWAKDYGGSCIVRVTLKSGGQTVQILDPLFIPLDSKVTGIADVYITEQQMEWVVRYAFTSNLPVPNFTSNFDSEPKNPDKLPGDHKTEGDGLTAFEEYRGFILDYGPDHNGGHRRLGFARKELLVQVTEMPKIKKTIEAGENPDVADAYDRQKMYEVITDLYRHPEYGAGIDVYWVHVPLLDYERSITYGGVHQRDHAYLHTKESIKEQTTTSVGGGSYIWRDLRLRFGNSFELEEFEKLFLCSIGQQGPMRHFENTRDPALGRFVNLLLINRWGEVYYNSSTAAHWYRVPRVGPATSRGQYNDGYYRQGALVAVGGIAEEGPYINDGNSNHYTKTEFIGVLHWAIAHELAHLLVGAGHPGGSNRTALIGTSTPGREGISIIRLNEAERMAIDVRNRYSARP